MIDLHCHILYGLDDGPKTIEESVELAKAAADQGIHTIVATPHHQNGRYINEKETILRGVAELNDMLRDKGINVTILPGQEIRLYGEVLEDYDAGRIATINETNKYILIEFPTNHVPRYTESLFYDLQLRGFIPVIAHPERNMEIIERPAILYDLINKGALAQLTAASITGDFGKKIKKFSMQLIEHNLVHMVVSDAHNTINRMFKLREAYAEIQSLYGDEMLYQFQDTAYDIIGGKVIDKYDPEQIRKKKFLGIF